MMEQAGEYFHPSVGFCYFACMIVIAMLFLNPLYIAAGLFCAVAVHLVYSDFRTLIKMLLYSFPLFLMVAVFNPLVNSGGKTVLLTAFGRPFTFEALFYGACTGAMLVLILLWFSSYNRVVTPEKFLFLFSKAAPSAALLVVMAQRMAPLFAKRVRLITAAQKTLLCDMSQGDVHSRFRNGLSILSVLMSWSMEEGLDTADSMKARGYGVTKRTFFSVYTFRRTDLAALLFIFACFAVCLFGYYSSPAFLFFPLLRMDAPGPGMTVSLTAFFVMGLLPAVAKIKEAVEWR